MPKVLEDRRKLLMARNPSMPKGEAYAIATTQMQKAGKMPAGRDRTKRRKLPVILGNGK